MVVAVGRLSLNKEKKVLVFIPKKGNDLFFAEDPIDAMIVYITKIKGEPIGAAPRGNLYDIKDIEFESHSLLYLADTMKTLLDLGIITHEYDTENPVCHNWLLSELIQQKDYLNTDVLTAVYEDKKELYDKRTLSGWIGLANSAKSLEWLLEHGAELEYVPGYGNPVKWQLIKQQSSQDSSIIEYLMKKFYAASVEELEALCEE